MKLYLYFLAICLALPEFLNAQTGSIAEPVRYIGGQTIDPSVHEGRLRYAIGTENIQTMRANRTHPEYADGMGWTYNHASNLCYWNGLFFQQYLSNPIDEHIDPGQTLLLTSKDGRQWNKPEVVFPPYRAAEGVKLPEGYNGYMMHQRMGFYVAPDGRLLILGFYGHAEDPFGKGGIGRVVRERYKDGSYSPIYFIRYESQANWNASNTTYPFYKSAADSGFIIACDNLLKDPLMTFQWFDEDNGANGFYKGKQGEEALSYYHRKDGKVVALWKHSFAAISEDEGQSFSTPVKVPTLLMSGGKQWGQKTADGRYAISYNPIEQSEYRFPLVVITGDDGIIYDNMLLVQGEVPPRRFSGRWKDFGPCYMRGIEEGNGTPPDGNMWLTYTMNKEDVWIARIPVPITYRIQGIVNDNFDDIQPNGIITNWNIYSPAWAPVCVTKAPGKSGNALKLTDKDNCDYSRAVRVFEEGKKINVSLKFFAEKTNAGELTVDITDQFGNRPVRIEFSSQGQILATDGSKTKLVQLYEKEHWYKIDLQAETGPNGYYKLSIDDKPVFNGRLAEFVKTFERLSLRTGAYRNLPNRQTPNETNDPPLNGADEYADPTAFYIDDIRINKLN